MPMSPGTRLGVYEIAAQLGVGEVRDPWPRKSISIHATFENSRSDPRFQDIRRRTNLPT